MSIEAMCCLRRLPPDSLFERAGHQSYVFRCSCDPRSMLCAATPIGASSSASHRSLVSVVATNRDTWSEATPSRSSGSSSGRWTDKLLYVGHAFRCRPLPVVSIALRFRHRPEANSTSCAKDSACRAALATRFVHHQLSPQTVADASG